MDRRRDRAKSDLDEVSAAAPTGTRPGGPGGPGPMLTDPFTAVPAPKGPAAQPRASAAQPRGAAAQPRGSAAEPGMSPVWPKPPAAQPAAGQQPPRPGGRSGPARRPEPGGRRSQRSQAGGPNGPGGPGGPGDGSPAARPPGKSRKRTILKWASVVTTIVLVAASLAAYVAYRDVVDGIKQEDVSNLLGKSRPPQYTSALNILVIGSDSRVGTDGQFGSTQAIQGARSDTMMLLHILPDHKGAVVISFPRDSLVPIIGCSADGQGDKGQTATAGQNEMLNATYAAGGAACLWKTLESTTGIYINHFVEINFSGFTSVVNDLGGVNVCLPEAINDPASGLNLTAGEHHVSGAQALAFVRERHVGLGSDLQRIQRQQFFMAALLQQIDSEQVLSNVPKVFAIARDVAKTLTTDSGLSVDDMRNIATSMKGLSTKGVQFTQVPVVPDPTDANRVLWEQPQASQLFGEVAHDQTVPGKAKATATPAASASPSASAPAVSPSAVQVNVLNATSTAGLASQAASSLTQSHFTVLGTGNAVAPSSTTIIQYSSATEAAAAKALAAVVPNAQVQPVSASSGVASDAVDLILGSDYTGLKGATASASPSPTASSSSSSINNVTKTYGGISGNTNICSDKGAFSGPDQPSEFSP
jgi:LCP family protein required for cell wall assembly